MKKLLIIAACALSLAGCATTGGTGVGGIPASPSEVANKTTLDEKGGIAADTAYYAANRLAALAIRTGIVTDKATIAQIGKIDLAAKAAVQKVRDAYDAGNATSYAAALAEADRLTKSLIALAK